VLIHRLSWIIVYQFEIPVFFAWYAMHYCVEQFECFRYADRSNT
jgi:hypothetical protein